MFYFLVDKSVFDETKLKGQLNLSEASCSYRSMYDVTAMICRNALQHKNFNETDLASLVTYSSSVEIGGPCTELCTLN
jgi:intracellular sulfur oxidation DsrE/DsrF family protein